MTVERFTAIDDPARLAGLRRLGLLDTPPEPAFDRLTRLAAKVLDAPVALVTLVDADRQFFKSSIGLTEPWASLGETPLAYSFCQYGVTCLEPVVIEDAREHPLFHDNPAIPELGVVAYAGIPLLTSEGLAVGAFCVIDHRPRDWTQGDLDLLEDLAAAAMTEIELRVLARERAELLTSEQAARAEVETVRQTVLSAVSHELLTPLTIIKGHADTIRDLGTSASPSLVEAALTAIDEEVERSRWLVGNLLDTVRASTGGLTVSPAPLLLTPLIERALRHFQGRSRRHHLVADLPTEVPRVLGERERLESVLYNLLDNAIKYMPRGGPVAVRVTVHPTEVEVTVEDRGLGIPMVDQPHVFDAYYRAVRSEALHIEGRGLGLYLCKTIVEAHGGRIWLVSTQGRGTAFHFTVPHVESESLLRDRMDR